MAETDRMQELDRYKDQLRDKYKQTVVKIAEEAKQKVD